MRLIFCCSIIQAVSFNYHQRNVRSRVLVSNFQVSVSVTAFMAKSRSRLEIWARSRSRRLRSRLHHCKPVAYHHMKSTKSDWELPNGKHRKKIGNSNTLAAMRLRTRVFGWIVWCGDNYDVTNNFRNPKIHSSNLTLERMTQPGSSASVSQIKGSQLEVHLPIRRGTFNRRERYIYISFISKKLYINQ